MAAAALACTLSISMATGVSAAEISDPFIDELVSFTAGTGAGFGQDALPDVILGPPQGAGLLEGSKHVISLGNGGEIVVRMTDDIICNGVGVDFTVFENAFHVGSEDGAVFTEVGIVAVSQDGLTFFEFPYDRDSFIGLAGITAVLSHPDNGIDPTDPSVSGGDQFDLADVGLAWASYIRITDPGSEIPDAADFIPPGDNGGFDLDAIAVLNPCVSPPSSTTTLPGDTSTTSSTTTTTTTTTTTSTSTTTLPGPVCGNGIREADEQCDRGAASENSVAQTTWTPGQWCRESCTAVLCGDPDDNGSHTASDALFVLRAAVGVLSCDEEVCNVDASEGPSPITAGDALRLLRVSVGTTGLALVCPTGEPK